MLCAAIADAAEDDGEDAPGAGSADASLERLSGPIPPRLSRVAAWRLQSSLTALAPAVWVQDQVVTYLSATPAATQSRAAIASTLSALRSFLCLLRLQLTNVELLQLVNLRPLTLVEVHRIIEECEERMGERDILELLDILRENLPPAPGQADGDSASALFDPPLQPDADERKSPGTAKREAKVG